MSLDPNEQGIPERVAVEAGGRTRFFARAVHFHNTPASRARELAAVLARCSPRAAWSAAGPPVAVFFEGYRNQYDVALRLLDRLGVRAWFVIPTDFLDVPAAAQRRYAAERDLGLVEGDRGRVAMSWAELRGIAARGHAIASHTASHCTLAEWLAAGCPERELAGSRARLEAQLGVAVQAICWRYGAAFGEDPRADAAMRAAGYRTVIAQGRIQTLDVCPIGRSPV